MMPDLIAALWDLRAHYPYHTINLVRVIKTPWHQWSTEPISNFDHFRDFRCPSRRIANPQSFRG